jgi:hypothetical protein
MSDMHVSFPVHTASCGAALLQEAQGLIPTQHARAFDDALPVIGRTAGTSLYGSPGVPEPLSTTTYPGKPLRLEMNGKLISTAS